MQICFYNLKDVNTPVNTNACAYGPCRWAENNRRPNLQWAVAKVGMLPGSEVSFLASGFGRATVYTTSLVISNRGKERLPYFIAFMILIHLKSGCLFRDNWKKKFCGRMLWFWLNQVFGQISPCQWKHSLPEVVTFVGGKELALKQIMKQMFYAKSESGDT